MVRLTRLFTVGDNVNEHDNEIKEAAKLLREGKIVAFPTETVYGLGANALDAEALKKVFLAKGRPSDNPLIVHIATIDQLDSLVEEVDDISQKLIANFWPGPLTIIFRKKQGISDIVTAGLSSIAVRMPNNQVALALIKAADLPIAAPSANRSGKPSPTKAEHVWNDLNGLIDGLIDGGSTGIGVESTVIDVSTDIPIVLRPGGITIEELEDVIGHVELDKAILNQIDKPRSPGMKYKHYAPEGEMLIVRGEREKVIQTIQKLINEKKAAGYKVGVLTTEEYKQNYQSSDLVLAYGNQSDMYPLAANLYHALRDFDSQNINYIIAQGVDETGIGLTIMNRLRKAASSNILELNS